MKTYFFVVLSLLRVLTSEALGNEKDLRQKFPYSLLTPSYGIVTESDLALDKKNRNMSPFDPNGGAGGLYWQCFAPNEITTNYEIFTAPDSEKKSKIKEELCSMLTQSHGKDFWNSFHGRHANPVSYCRNFMKAWKQLSKGETHICISGDFMGLSREVHDGVEKRVQIWTWDKIKSKKGCYSYWGDCAGGDIIVK